APASAPTPAGAPELASPAVKIDPALAEFRAGETLAVHGRLGHASLLARAPEETFLFIDINAAADAKVARTPVELALAIDQSGSMRGDRQNNALAAARGMIGRLRDGDSVSVLTFSGRADVLVQPTVITPESRARVLSQLTFAPSKGHTCLSCSIDTGLELLRRRQGGIDRMLLLTDGEANRGRTQTHELRALASQARAAGVAISTLGVDADYNEDALTAISKESNGHHYFVERPSQLAPVFEAELGSLVASVARGAVLTVDLAPGVEVLEIYDRSVQRAGARLSAPLGTFSAGESKTLLVKLQLPPGELGPRDVADVALHYNDLTTGTSGQAHGALATTLVEDPRGVASLDAHVLGRITRSETVRALDEASAMFDRGDDAAARTAIERQLGVVRDQRELHNKRAAAGELEPDAPDPVAGQSEVLEQALSDLEARREREKAEEAASRRTGAPAVKKKRTLRKQVMDALDPFG
ncbi:MAG: VWA domain-containing protein, partial [Myxococcales bacterium]|nr:VWA domain-containing protein [Myxococcales bacterium]